MKDNSIILLSGGLDSITVLAMQRKNYKKMISLSFFYDQKHKLELELAKKISEKYNCNHIIINLDPQLFLGTSLVSKNNLEIPTNNLALNPACPKSPDTDTKFGRADSFTPDTATKRIDAATNSGG